MYSNSFHLISELNMKVYYFNFLFILKLFSLLLFIPHELFPEYLLLFSISRYIFSYLEIIINRITFYMK